MQGIFELLKKNPHYQLSSLWAGSEAHLDTLGTLRELSTCRQGEGPQTSSQALSRDVLSEGNLGKEKPRNSYK